MDGELLETDRLLEKSAMVAEIDRLHTVLAVGLKLIGSTRNRRLGRR